MNRNDFNNYISNADFLHFFNELGWDKAAGRNTVVSIDDVDYELTAVAQKKGFAVFTCEVDTIPPTSFCKRFDNSLRKDSNDYILIFNLKNTFHHLWVVPVKTVEKRNLVLIEYQTLDQTDFLFSKLNNLSFGLDEEVTIVDVTSRIHNAFEINASKITKDFYAGFKKQHTSFSTFIRGIDVEGDKQLYVSVMLNRLMFCYFIQKKGFLNFDPDYLRRKLEWTQEQQGLNHFFGTFYKGFLCALFHDGLNSPRHDEAFEQKYGRIPYLNGGMFDEHALEKQYSDLDIDDRAFEDLFDFFDKWRWHLDTRITASGKDINPDVLGYIFEQYINDRAQMGAYYTKEDITEYIGKNCILPFLMENINHGNLNNLIKIKIQTSGQKYIYPAVKKGYGKPVPEPIARGIDTQKPNLLERRSEWNKPAPDEFALPTEIWRETIERLQRCNEITRKIAAGEITHINDFITYNLNIRSFVEDLLRETNDHLFIGHFYHALQRITILDPTCGSGAFLFAALNILEPLYEICIDRMEEFHKQNDKWFMNELDEIEQKYRSNIQYFIYKSIILRNLYGVDIMAEATEIAKLRLFLKMVAVVEVDRRAQNLGLDPLPDIDFNIRCGNTLIGFASLDEAVSAINAKDKAGQMGLVFEDELDIVNSVKIKADDLAVVFKSFKQAQLDDDLGEFKKAKDKLQSYQADLNNLLNEYLAFTYGIDTAKHPEKYRQWLASHQPFHWFAEFYEIIQGNGGFDVIIGNPPYVEYSKVIYKLNNYNTISCGNLYTFVLERSYQLIRNNGFFGMIVPLSICCGDRMLPLRNITENTLKGVICSNFEIFPSKLFDGAFQRLTILVGNKNNYGNTKINVSRLHRWYSIERDFLISKVNYTTIISNEKLPLFGKYQSNIHFKVISKIVQTRQSVAYFCIKSKLKNYIYYQEATNYWMKATALRIPFYKKNKIIGTPDHGRFLYLEKEEYTLSLFSILNSSLFYVWYITYSDGFHLSDMLVKNFPIDEKLLKNKKLIKFGELLGQNIENNSIRTTRNTKTDNIEIESFRINLSKPIIDEIDKVLAEHYGFTEEELDFIINYDIKYRMGNELNEEEEE